MNRQLFVDYIKYPEKLDANSILKLESLVNDFPYCQSAGTLYTLNLYKDNNIKYHNSLKISAAYIADRVLLKKLIKAVEQTETKGSQFPQKAVPVIVEENNKIHLRQKSSIEEMDIKEMIELLRDKIELAEQSNISPNQKSQLPLIASKLNEIIDKYSLDNYTKPINKKTATEYAFDHLEEIKSGNLGSNKNQELIDKFIEDRPSISPPPKTGFFNPIDYAKHSIIDKEDIVSETLANIYYKQGNLLKAINIYKKLSLLNPEKRTYFAALIQKIRNEVK